VVIEPVGLKVPVRAALGLGVAEGRGVTCADTLAIGEGRAPVIGEGEAIPVVQPAMRPVAASKYIVRLSHHLRGLSC
jgi:hypothetical protein